MIIEGKNTNNQVIENSKIEDDKRKEDEEKYSKNLIGMWHASPNIAAGYNDYYEFSEDGSFIFKYSQYNGENRIVDISGDWEIIFGNLLALKIKNKTVIEGGEFSKDITSETTEYILRNGTIKNTN